MDAALKALNEKNDESAIVLTRPVISNGCHESLGRMTVFSLFAHLISSLTNKPIYKFHRHKKN
jgi:hypothetical protein